MRKDVCAELETMKPKKTMAGFLKKRKSRCEMEYTLRLCVQGNELDVLKAALKLYIKNTAVKTKKAIAEDLLGLIGAQESYQDIKN